MLYVLLVIAFALLFLLLFGLWKLFRFLVATWQSNGANRSIKRSAVALVVCGLFAVPFSIQFFTEASQIASRIPAPFARPK